MTSTITDAGPLALTEDRDRVVFSSRGRDLATYVHTPDTARFESPKPYVHPIRTLAGREVSLFRPHDHVWHKGLAWSLPNVGTHNFWGGPTYTRRAGGYEQLPNNGGQDHAAVVEARADADGARFAHDLVWHAESGEEVFRERRELTARFLDDEAWVLGWRTVMTNVSGEEIRIGSPTTEGRENAGYGGLFWRGPRSFSDGQVLSPEGPGDAEELRSTRHPWLAFVGRHDGDGASSTVLVADVASSSDDPPEWFVRSNIFGCLNPAPFFSAEVPIADGADLSFAYAVVVADGASDTARASALAAAGSDAVRGDAA